MLAVAVPRRPAASGAIRCRRLPGRPRPSPPEARAARRRARDRATWRRASTTGGVRLGVIEVEILRADVPGRSSRRWRAPRRVAGPRPGRAWPRRARSRRRGPPCAWPPARCDGGRVSALSSVATLVVQPPPPGPHDLVAELEGGVGRAELGGRRAQPPPPDPVAEPVAVRPTRRVAHAVARAFAEPVADALRPRFDRGPARRRAPPRAGWPRLAVALAVALPDAQAACPRVPRLPPQRSRRPYGSPAPGRAPHDERIRGPDGRPGPALVLRRGHGRLHGAGGGERALERGLRRPSRDIVAPAAPERRRRPRAARTASRSRGARPPKPDLATYRVYREAPGGPRERVGEVAPPETSLRDTTRRARRALLLHRDRRRSRRQREHALRARSRRTPLRPRVLRPRRGDIISIEA